VPCRPAARRRFGGTGFDSGLLLGGRSAPLFYRARGRPSVRTGCLTGRRVRLIAGCGIPTSPWSRLLAAKAGHMPAAIHSSGITSSGHRTLERTVAGHMYKGLAVHRSEARRRLPGLRPGALAYPGAWVTPGKGAGPRPLAASCPLPGENLGEPMTEGKASPSNSGAKARGTVTARQATPKRLYGRAAATPMYLCLLVT
jgi:hypothetical protein